MEKYIPFLGFAEQKTARSSLFKSEIFQNSKNLTPSANSTETTSLSIDVQHSTSKVSVGKILAESFLKFKMLDAQSILASLLKSQRNPHSAKTKISERVRRKLHQRKLQFDHRNSPKHEVDLFVA